MGSERDQPVKVLYVAGSGRSGTTNIANVLGQTKGFVSVGEMYMMWESALVTPNACGCRNLVPDCPFWNEVFDDAFGGIDAIDPAEMNRMLRARYRTRHYVLPRALDADFAAPGPLQRNLGRLYRSIARVSGARVIVDASKRPVYGRLLGQVPGIELFALHMVRDPRAVAYSWARKKIKLVLGRPTRRMSLSKSSLQWVGLNLVAEKSMGGGTDSSHYLQLRYEDFAERPRIAYRAVLEMLGESRPGDPFTSDSRVKLEVSHTLAGNSSRFDVGLVDVVPDREWESRMGLGPKLLVSALTWPLLPRYRYPLLPLKTRQ